MKLKCEYKVELFGYEGLYYPSVDEINTKIINGTPCYDLGGYTFSICNFDMFLDNDKKKILLKAKEK